MDWDRAARVSAVGASLLAGLLLILTVSVIPVSAATVSPSDLDSALKMEKTVFKTGELVRVIFLVYNPSVEPVVLHFQDGCWVNFLVEDTSGRVWFNQTTPYGCDPDFSILNLVTNRTTIEPGRSRGSDLYWKQTGQSGERVPVPGEYVLTVRVLSLEPGPIATGRVTVLSEVQSSAEAWSAGVLFFIRELTLVVAFVPVFLGNLANRGRKGPKGWKGFRAQIPWITTVGGVMILYFASFSDEFLCEAIDCSGTLALVGLTRTLSLVLMVAWMALLALMLVVSRERWFMRYGFEVGFSLSGLFAMLALTILSRLWDHMLYSDWVTEGLSWAIVWTMPFGLWLSNRAGNSSQSGPGQA